MRITVVGGGNIGTQFAVHCAEKGHEVTIFTSRPDLYDGSLSIIDENGITTHQGQILLATNNPEAAFNKAELIFVTTPATLMEKTAQMVFRHTRETTIIGVVPGNGGSECAFKRCIERGNVFFGIERVPAIARLIEKGKTVRSVGYRRELHVSSLPISRVLECCVITENIFDIPCIPIPNYLNLTMTPSNPILHTSRLRTVFKGYSPGMTYESLPLFYEEWDDDSSKLLIACDEEVQTICRALPDFHLDYVKSLRIHYESPTVETMTQKISNIPAFKGLPTPSIEINGRLIPDLHSRYFTADFSYGLEIIRQVGRFAGVNTPTIDETMRWYESIAIEKSKFNFSYYEIKDKDSLKSFYLF